MKDVWVELSFLGGNQGKGGGGWLLTRANGRDVLGSRVLKWADC